MIQKITLFTIIIILLLIESTTANYSKKILQYESGGHILGFEQTGMYIAGGSHALHIQFEGTSGVDPISTTNFKTEEQKAPKLTEVRYPELWKGITLSYAKHMHGIVESEYYIEPGARIEDISLKYNIPVGLNQDGSLGLKFQTGNMTESAPIAWQMIKGQKRMVDIAFCQKQDNTIGFKTGVYNTDYPVIIDPVISWHSFIGGTSQDFIYAHKIDGNVKIQIDGNCDSGLELLRIRFYKFCLELSDRIKI